MGLPTQSLRAYLRETFEPRLREVSKGGSRLFVEKHRKLLLLGFAVFFGIVAYRVTANEARIDWLMANRPRIETWETLLIARHFVPVLDPKELEALVPSLPYLRSGRDPRVWITENHRVFVLFDPSGTRVYSLGKGLPEKIEPELWEPLGHGWDAYETLSVRTLPIPYETVMRPKKGRKNHRDTREIDF